MAADQEDQRVRNVRYGVHPPKRPPGQHYRGNSCCVPMKDEQTLHHAVGE